MNSRQKKKLKKRDYFRHYKQYKIVKKFFYELQTDKKIHDLVVNAAPRDAVSCESEFNDNELLGRLREESIRTLKVPKEMVLVGKPLDDVLYDEYRDTQYKIYQEFASIIKQHLKGVIK